MCSGFTGFESESRSDRLWIPQGTQAQDDSKTYTNTFDNPFRIDWIIAEADDGEALKKTNLEKLMAIHDAVSAIEATEDVSTEVRSAHSEANARYARRSTLPSPLLSCPPTHPPTLPCPPFLSTVANTHLAG